MFHAIVFCLCSWRLAGVFGTEYVSVMEGDPVTLNIDLTEIQRDEVIMLKFGLKDALVAELKRGENQITLIHVNERFRDRLKLDEKTGSLTINNTRTTDSGLFKVTSMNKETQLNMLNITVYAHLPVPIIIIDCPSSSSSGSSVSKCSLLCSVLNVRDVTLSWYKGISVLSSISVSDLSISLSLPLEVEYQDNNTYSCVIYNPIRNQTTHLDISRLCHTREDNRTVVLAASISAVLLVVLAGLMYFLYWKHKRMGQKGNGYEPSAHTVEIAQTEREEVQYAVTEFFKQNGQRKKANEKEETIYSSIVT